MYIVCLGVSEELIDELIRIGVRDSKKLSPKGRFALVPKIASLAKIIIVGVVRPKHIDEGNINEIFAYFVINSLRYVLELGIPVKRAYIDAVSGRRFHDLIKNFLTGKGLKVEVVLEPKADEKYPVVAAASIIAKYLRDLHVMKLHALYGDFGSGYPSDPKTIRWLSRYSSIDELPPIVRRSWSTLKKLGICKGNSKDLSKWFK